MRLPEFDIELPFFRFSELFNHSGTNIGSLLFITRAEHYNVETINEEKIKFFSQS